MGVGPINIQGAEDAAKSKSRCEDADLVSQLQHQDRQTPDEQAGGNRVVVKPFNHGRHRPE